jgi:Glycosyltransferase family 87
MSLRSRLPGLSDAVVAVAMIGLLSYIALRVVIWEDFFTEAGPSVGRLMAGDLHGFLTLAPAYGGSLLLRAPVMALGGELSGLDGAYRFGSIFCVLAVAVLALVLAKIQRSDGQSAFSRWMLIIVLVASPAANWALKEGHPEELLTAALCVGAMLLVVKGKITPAAILLGLAMASKQWAILALPLALAATPEHRTRFSISAGLSALALSAPMAIAAAGNFITANRGLVTAPSIFHPQQIWWTLHLSYIRPVGGPHSTIFAPAPIAVVAQYSHPFIGLIAVLLGLAFWLRFSHLQPSDALLMLALVLLVRCMFDPWNVLYYQYPFLVALATWEVVGRRQTPWFALACTCLVWMSFRMVNLTASGSTTNLFYISWVLPGATMMLWRSLRLPRPRFLVTQIGSPSRSQKRAVPLEQAELIA